MPDYTANIERFTGFADVYDEHRPQPPAILAELLPRIAAVERPQLIVDLGAGTGLSTRYWSGKADRIIGVEPSESMRAQAEKTPAEGVTYRAGFSHATGLPTASADIVTVSQALHWMEPTGTFKEAARILRPGGVFAAFDYDWPPITGNWEVDQAYERCMSQGRKLEKEYKLSKKLQQWDKPGHAARMRESKAFRFVRQAEIHHRDEGNAERLLGILFSQGYIQSLLKKGLSEEAIGIDTLRETAERLIGKTSSPWLWSSFLRYAVV